MTKIALADRASVLQVQGPCAKKDNDLKAFGPVDLVVHSGEIVGIAGVSGNGQRKLVEVLAGQHPATQGQIHVSSQVYGATRPEMTRLGVFTLPEEPLPNACVPGMSVAENMALRTFDRPPGPVEPLARVEGHSPPLPQKRRFKIFIFPAEMCNGRCWPRNSRRPRLNC